VPPEENHMTAVLRKSVNPPHNKFFGKNTSSGKNVFVCVAKYKFKKLLDAKKF